MKTPILLLPCKTCSDYRIFLLNSEIKSAGLGKLIALWDLLMILDELVLCFSLDTASIFSILWRVVLVVFFECLPESVRDRSRV